MLSLMLMRHAKSSRGDPTGEDRDRPLNNRGTEAARKMGKALASRRLIPDRIICSPAERTKATLNLLLQAFRETPEVEYREALYSFGDGSPYLKCIQKEARRLNRLMLIGHNPSIQNLALGLCNDTSDDKAIGAMRRKFPTGAVAAISLPIEAWQQIAPGSGRLELFLAPAMLDDD